MEHHQEPVLKGVAEGWSPQEPEEHLEEPTQEGAADGGSGGNNALSELRA